MKPGVARLVLITVFWLLASCASKPVSVQRLKHIQDTEGFMSQSLFYCGSTKDRHYFEQDQPFEGFITGIGDGVHKFVVSRTQISMPPGMEYGRSEYEGQDDDQRRKIRLRAPDAASGRAAVTPRKSAGERWVEKHGPFDPSRIRFHDAGDGTVRVEYAD
jgi:hypothetical protein